MNDGNIWGLGVQPVAIILTTGDRPKLTGKLNGADSRLGNFGGV